MFLQQLPDAYCTPEELERKKTITFAPILQDYRLAKEFGWTYQQISAQPDLWLSEIESCIIADAMIQHATMDETRQKRAKGRKESHDHEDASTKGKSLAKVRSEYAAMGMMPPDATDEEVAAMIGRVD